MRSAMNAASESRQELDWQNPQVASELLAAELERQQLTEPDSQEPTAKLALCSQYSTALSPSPSSLADPATPTCAAGYTTTKNKLVVNDHRWRFPYRYLHFFTSSPLLYQCLRVPCLRFPLIELMQL